MRQLKYLFVFFFIGCASTKVAYDYDSKVRFEKYKTFSFFDDAGKGLHKLDVKRVCEALTKELQKKGIHLSETPDFYINIISKEHKSLNRNTIGIGIGGGRNIGFGISGGIPIGSRKINQELIIDFVEHKNNQLIWQGIASSEIKENTTPQIKDEFYKKVIVKLLKGYPPKKAPK